MFGQTKFLQLIELALRWLPITILVVLLASICMFFILDFPQYKYTGEAKQWPTVDATITSSNLDTEDAPDGPFVKGLHDKLYNAHVEYDYVVNGTKFHSARISIAGWGNRKTMNGLNEYEYIVAKFPKSAITKAYYNSSEPSSAVLMPGVDTMTIMSQSLFIGTLIALLCLNIYIFCLIIFLLRSYFILGIILSSVLTFFIFTISFVAAGYIASAAGGLLPRFIIPHEWLMS